MQIYLLLVGVIGKARMLIFLVSWYFYNVESNRLLRNLVRHVLLKMKRLLWMNNSQMWIVFLKMRYFFFFSLIVIITREINYIIPVVFIWVGKGFIGNWLRRAKPGTQRPWTGSYDVHQVEESLNHHVSCMVGAGVVHFVSHLLNRFTLFCFLK